ncbi:MAG: 4Fe-4S double cluster binding domain-containing protein [Candidatus Aminicenantales bacterium]
MKIGDAIQNWAKKKGYRVAAGGVAELEEVRTTLRKRRDEGEIAADFFRENLDVFTYLDGCSLKNPKSILIVAVPLPAHILSFSVAGKTVETILPPTYVRYRRIFEEVRDDLGAALADLGCRVELLNAPLKALGNRLGLLSHGRNNIGYIEGLGSYFQLVGLVSDKRIDERCLSPRAVEKLLPRCRDCRLCAKACPTGAIDRERILIHAEKCYTLFSESPKPIPEGLKLPSPKCLIGCLRCQQVCPENKGLLRHEKAAVSFDSDETAAFLGLSGESRRIVDRVQTKFHKLGLTEGIPVFARNLEFMLKLRRII